MCVFVNEVQPDRTRYPTEGGSTLLHAHNGNNHNPLIIVIIITYFTFNVILIIIITKLTIFFRELSPVWRRVVYKYTHTGVCRENR
jgi:hypothetical protein